MVYSGIWEEEGYEEEEGMRRRKMCVDEVKGKEGHGKMKGQGVEREGLGEGQGICVCTVYAWHGRRRGRGEVWGGGRV